MRGDKGTAGGLGRRSSKGRARVSPLSDEERFRALRIVSEAQTGLLQLDDPAAIFRLAGEKILELIGDGYAAVTIFDESKQSFRAAGYFGLGGLLSKGVKILGRNPLAMEYPIADILPEELRAYRSGRLERLEGGLYAVLVHRFPRPLCEMAEKLLGVHSIYTFGFVWQGIHLGGLILLTKRPIEEWTSMIELIMSGASLTINRLRAERRMQAALREKEVLLREIHHRVKNNLQVVSSLLSLQSRHIRDEAVQDAFKDAQARIRSLAMIHERFYKTSDLARISLSDYAKALVSELVRVLNADPGRIRIRWDLAEIPLDIETAIPCGLILNELVINALKYAFPDGRQGVLGIKLQNLGEGRCRLVVSDDGVGLPAGLDVAKTKTFGLELVSILVRQLEGRLTVERSGGTAFSIVFRELREEPRT